MSFSFRRCVPSLKEISSSSTGSDIAFSLKTGHFLQKLLRSIRNQRSSYGHVGTSFQKECVCVEYSSPNIAKPFHVGHLRSTIIGNVISNMYESAGHDVKRVNFLGDWGTQFGLLTLGYKKYCEGNSLVQDPLHELFKIYVKVNQDVKSECGKGLITSSQTYQESMALFTKLEKGDPELRHIWKMLTTVSMDELNKMYERLGVKFTHMMPESDFHNKMGQVLRELNEKCLLQYDENGVGYVSLDSEEYKGKAKLLKSDGSSLYLTRDIAAALEREKMFSCDRMHYVVELGQREHFSKLKGVLNLIGVPWASRPVDQIHIRFGRVKGMSTRKGQVVFLNDILEIAKEKITTSMLQRQTTKVSEDLEEVADQLAVSSIILQDLKSNRAKDYTFSWDRMLSFKADSGIFVQYCHARLCSMLSSCDIDVYDDINFDCIVNDSNMTKLAIELARYPDVFEDALNKLEPHHIVQYTFRLCHVINATYASCQVKGQPTDIAQARLLVFHCARQVLANSLQVLGLKPLERI